MRFSKAHYLLARSFLTLPAHCPIKRIPVVTFFLVSPAVLAADQEYINGAVNESVLSFG